MASTASPTQSPRLDKIEAGSFVRLRLGGTFNGPTEELAIFLGVSGEGDDRQAKFAQPAHVKTSVFTWEAYRYKGAWVYGSSADRLSLLEVIA